MNHSANKTRDRTNYSHIFSRKICPVDVIRNAAKGSRNDYSEMKVHSYS